jgi:hypothetical protein
MKVQATFCHSCDASASDLSPQVYPTSPLDCLFAQLEDLKLRSNFNATDWSLIEKYLLMPLFDVNSIFELEISAYGNR